MDNIALNKSDTGAKSYVAVEGMDTGNILSNVQVSGNLLTYDIAASAETGKTAAIDITITTSNYTDITATLTINITAKAAQTIAFTASSQAKTYGDAKFTSAAALQGTGGSGAITYASDNTAVATVNSATGEVTIAGVGSANIIATKAADDDYAEATATYGLTVSKKTVTVKIDDKTVKVGESLPVLNVSYSAYHQRGLCQQSR